MFETYQEFSLMVFSSMMNVELISQDETIQIVRQTSLLHSSKIFPYENASISFESLTLSGLSPLSLYVLKSGIYRIENLYRELQCHRFDITALSGLLKYEVNSGQQYKITCPIVEAYWDENAGCEVRALVDGLHRCTLARNIGLSQVNCIVIRNVPVDLPLIAYPVNWDEVNIVSEIPKEEEKRRWRFKNGEEFPDVSRYGVEQPKQESRSYFFYRDLKALGSGEIRVEEII